MDFLKLLQETDFHDGIVNRLNFNFIQSAVEFSFSNEGYVQSRASINHIDAWFEGVGNLKIRTVEGAETLEKLWGLELSSADFDRNDAVFFCAIHHFERRQHRRFLFA